MLEKVYKQIDINKIEANENQPRKVFDDPACINTIPRIIAMSIRSLAVMGRCCVCDTIRSSWVQTLSEHISIRSRTIL